MKKILLLLQLLIPIMSHAYDAQIDGIYYNLDLTSKTACVTYQNHTQYTGINSDYSGNIIIPESITYQNTSYKVTQIGELAFAKCGNISSISIPNSIIYIGKAAFSGCIGLKNINLPNEITCIEECLFENCENLSSIAIPDNVSIIKPFAFTFCTGLKSISIPSNLSSIGEYAFQECKTLSHFTIPSSLLEIGSGAFNGCNGIESVEYHCQVIGSWFGGKSNLKNVVIGDEVISIGRGAFGGCRSLEEIDIPENVVSIGEYAFQNCTKLKHVILPSKINRIEEGTFNWCENLTSIIIPEDVTYVGNYAFGGCYRLMSINIPAKIVDIGYKAFNDCNQLNNLTINCSYIGSWFNNLHGLQNVILGEDVKEIGGQAFYNCSNLTSITIPTKVEKIGEKAFSGTNLTKTIWLPNTPPSGFSNAVGKINYVSNNQYTSIKNKIVYPFLSSMFEDGGIKYVPISPSERSCSAIDCVYDESANITKFSSVVSYKGLEMIVQEIGSYIFFDNKQIKHLTWNIEGNIPDYAFTDCSSLKKILLSNNVSSIGEYCFQNCTLLQSLSIPQSVTNIKDNAFQGCTGLKEFIIEDRENTLNLGSNGAGSLFASCPLDSIYIGGKISYSTSSTKGYSPFYRNTTLRTVFVTNKETEIFPNEFYGCANLQNVIIGDGIESIGDWAFSGCTNLKYFSFGTNVKTIGKEAFSDCTSITHIISHAIVAPVCGIQSLDDINKWNCVLSVPKGCKDNYLIADQWKDFFFIEDNANQTEDIERNFTETLQIKSYHGIISISGIVTGLNISVFDLKGAIVGRAKTDRTTVIPTKLKKGDIAILKFNNNTIKIVME